MQILLDLGPLPTLWLYTLDDSVSALLLNLNLFINHFVMSKLFLRRHATFDHEKDDPLTKAIAPPENETNEEREARLLSQAEAQKRSDAIDEEINRQRAADKRAPKCVRVLLLGKDRDCLEPALTLTPFHRSERIR